MISQELYEYLKDHKEDQDYSPVRLPFEIKLELVDKYITLYSKMKELDESKSNS